ncbi:hypothetical protein V4Y04_33905 [Streptomyces sp. P9-A2]
MSGLHPERLRNKVVVLTGAARGQGATEVEEPTREGARVIATAIAEAPASATRTPRTWPASTRSTSPTHTTGKWALRVCRGRPP